MSRTVLGTIAGLAALAWASPMPTATITASPVDPRQDVAITINRDPGAPAPRLAVPDFALTGSDPELKTASATTADVLWKDIAFEEEFTMVDRRASAAIPVTAAIESVPFDRWAEQGADYVLLVAATRNGAALGLDLQIADVKGRKLVERAGRHYNCFVADPRRCAHFVADDLHLRLRAVKGVAQSRIAFASDRDGERLAGIQTRNVKEIFIADYDGENEARVTANRSLNLSPTLSPDGQWLAYVSYRSNYPDIYVQPVYRAAGSLGRPARGTDVLQNFYPAFSPDGTKIAFGSGHTGDMELYVVDRDGKTPPARLTTSKGADIAPTWSPNGAQLAFVSDRSSPEVPLLYSMSSDGVGGARLLYGSRADRPSWSPTGGLIAFTCSGGAGYEICVYDLQTQSVRQVTQGGGTNEQPVFAPNGRHILFVTTRWGKQHLAVINIKGTTVHRLTELGNNHFPTWSAARAQ
jgi:TolB protein